MKRKIFSVAVCTIFLLILCTGCGSTSLADKSNSTAAYVPTAAQNENAMEAQDTTETAAPGEGGFSSSNVMLPAQAPAERKIIWTVDIEAETWQFKLSMAIWKVLRSAAVQFNTPLTVMEP